MHLVATYLGLASAVFAALAFPLGAEEKFIERRAIPTGTFNDLVFYFQYASSAYSAACAKPNGNTLVLQFSNIVTDTQGFIARDDNRKEIVVALRGSTSLTDFLVDVQIELIPYVSHGVKPPFGSLAHAGFLTAWNSVASEVLSTLSSQLAAHPGYALVSTGHSLGGALSSLAGVSLKENFPNRMFTYGQPRTFDPPLILSTRSLEAPHSGLSILLMEFRLSSLEPSDTSITGLNSSKPPTQRPLRQRSSARPTARIQHALILSHLWVSTLHISHTSTLPHRRPSALEYQ